MRFKLIALDAVIRSKLMYGLESAQLNEPQLKRLDLFHLKGLRKILRLETTYMNRANTNEEIYKDANEKIQEAVGKRKLYLLEKHT